MQFINHFIAVAVTLAMLSHAAPATSNKVNHLEARQCIRLGGKNMSRGQVGRGANRL